MCALLLAGGLTPGWIVLLGVACVLVLMLGLRVHAFLALLAAAVLVSALTVGPAAALAPVLAAFGRTAGDIAVVIALAAVIGKCLLASGAAGQIVDANVRALGVRRAPVGLLAGGYLLAIPVFFDTVFYLLVPLARALHRRTGAGYGLCLMALAVGAGATHALVPPTPGPLLVAQALGVPVGTAIGVGLAVTLPAVALAYGLAVLIDRRAPLVMRALPGEDLEGDGLAEGAPVGAAASGTASGQRSGAARPALALSLTPILLPLVLVGARAVLGAGAAGGVGEEAFTARPPGAFATALDFVGQPVIALALATLVSLYLLRRATGMGLRALSAEVEEALLGAGVIILITAAGGAFGQTLRDSGINATITEAFALSSASGLVVLLGAFTVASLLKVAQGSSTVAMIVASGMVSAAIDVQALAFHPVYVGVAIGGGSLVGSWMNDSAFWIYARMGGLTERETLRTWTIVFGAVGVAAFAVGCILSVILPLR